MKLFILLLSFILSFNVNASDIDSDLIKKTSSCAFLSAASEQKIHITKYHLSLAREVAPDYMIERIMQDGKFYFMKHTSGMSFDDTLKQALIIYNHNNCGDLLPSKEIPNLLNQ